MMPRRPVLGLGAVAALLALLMALLPLLIDANEFRPQIEQSIGARFGWSVRIGGDLRLSVLPSLAIELPGTTLAEGEHARPFARFERARVGVGLLSLLFGRIETTGISITRLDAAVERRRDGGTNIDQLVAALDPRGQARRGSGAGAVPSALASIELEDAKLTFSSDGTTVMTLSKLDLVTGASNPRKGVPVRISALAHAPALGAQTGLALSGTVHFEPSEAGFGVQGLQGLAVGSIAGERVEVAIRAPRVSLGHRLAAEQVDIRVSSKGSRDLRLEIGIAEVEGALQRASVRGLRIDANIKHGGSTTAARLGADAVVALQAETLRFSEFAGQLSIASPALGEGALDLRLVGAGMVDLARQFAEIEVDARSSRNRLKARVGLAGLRRLQIRVELEADRLHLDHILVGRDNQSGRSRFAKIDLSPLLDLDIAGLARVGQLQLAKVTAEDARLEFLAGEGGLSVTLSGASLYGGRCNGQAYVTSDGRQFGVRASLAGVAVGPLMRAAVDRDDLMGTADLGIELAAPVEGGRLSLEALGGRASMRIRDGAVRGVDLARSFREAEKGLATEADDTRSMDGALQTDFGQLSATFAVADGVARNEDLSAETKQLRIAGAGSIDLAAERIDFALWLMQWQDPGRMERRGPKTLDPPTIAVRLSGGREGMSYSIRRLPEGDRPFERGRSSRSRSPAATTAAVGSWR